MSDSTTYRAVRFRLHPGSRAKHNKLAQTAGACRWVWNRFLADNRFRYKMHKQGYCPKPSVSFFSLGKEFTGLRAQTPWLQEMSFAVVRYTLKYQADAWKQAFRHGGLPKFHAKRGDDSFTIPQDVRIVGNRLRIPKVGWVKLSRSGGNPYEGEKALRATVKRDCGKWYAVVLYAVEHVAGEDDGTAIGVNMNCGQVADSDGVIHRRPDVSRLEARRRRYQRRMARQRRGSNRRAVTRLRLRKTQRRIRQARHNWHHGVSRSMADSAHTVVVEDLRVKAMTASAEGTVDAPGTNVRQKAALNREILATGWSQLRSMLEYKAGRVLAVPPAYTSQTCRKCSTVGAMNRRSQSEFKCVHCGHRGNADINAALNILASGIGASGRGGGSIGWPVKRQNVSEELATQAANLAI